MKKGQILEGYIERVDFPNKGFAVVEDEEKKVIVKNTFPEQKVRFAVNKIRKGQAEGRLLEILEHSPEECQPACPHFGVCGGCTYQNLPYEKQVEMKEVQIHAMMDVHKRGSFHDIVNVAECKIVDEDFRRIIKAVLEFATDTGLPYYHRMRHTGFFRHLLVRKAVRTGEILIDLVTTSEAQLDEARLVEKLTGLSYDGRLAGILHTTNNSLADVVKDEGTKILYGQDYFYEELLGLKFKITPFSFFQTNSLGAEVLYEAARSYIGETKDKVIFDLYSGTGTIAQILAPVAKKVVGVEIVEEAVEAAKENAALNGLDNCTFWAGDVLKVIDDLGEVPDLIVLDPPRDGVHPKALEKIIDFGVERMVYIACKPTSLARDLELLQGRGYQVERIGCVDLFPSTYHVETAVLLQRKNM